MLHTCLIIIKQVCNIYIAKFYVIVQKREIEVIKKHWILLKNIGNIQ
jgi:hypothetical protein